MVAAKAAAVTNIPTRVAVDRRAWIDQCWAAVAACNAEAAAYDQNRYSNDIQQEWVQGSLATCPPGGMC
jgi:hypothetical protein